MRAYRAITTAVALVLAAACDGAVAPSPVTTSPAGASPAAPRAIALVSGNDQYGKAGEQLADPFVVRVTDGAGNGVSDFMVSFEIASGGGALGGRCDAIAPVLVRSSRTNVDGTAAMTFQPTVLGRSTVIARVGGLKESVTFAAEATILVVEFWFGFWNVGFVGPRTTSSDVSIPVGTTVEWKIPVEDDRYPVTYTITSTSIPPGARGFDSGMQLKAP